MGAAWGHAGTQVNYVGTRTKDNGRWGHTGSQYMYKDCKCIQYSSMLHIHVVRGLVSVEKKVWIILEYIDLRWSENH